MALTASLLAAVAGHGCTPRAATRAEVADTPADEQGTGRSLTYADGSGNAYVLDGSRLRYLPVTPETSSSGTYSGGAPFERTLSPREVSELTAALDAALAATASHIEHRIMTSGQVTEERTGTRRSAVLAPGSPEQRLVETVLSRLRPAKD